MRDAAVIGNWASQSGGGISNGTAAGTGDVKVVRSTVARNVAGTDGGGIAIDGSASLLTVAQNCTVPAQPGGRVWRRHCSASRATVTGSSSTELRRERIRGISIQTAEMTNCTVSGNTAAAPEEEMKPARGRSGNCTINGNSAGLRGGGTPRATQQ